MTFNLHRHTPSLTAVDPRGFLVRGIDYHRATQDQTPETLISRTQYSLGGNAIANWDPRLQLGAANQRQTYSLGGTLLTSHSVDAGFELHFHADSGLNAQRWDARGSHWRIEFDDFLRPVSVSETAAGHSSRIAQRFSYAAASQEAAARNQCGRLIRHDDSAGSLFYPDYGMGGDTLSETRQFLSALSPVDWPEAIDQRNALLEDADPATTRWHYPPTGEILSQTDALGNRQCSRYSVSGELSELHFIPRGGDKRVLLSPIRYNAFGQIEQQTSGNGVISQAKYDPADGHLLHLRASREQRSPLQDLSYGYDPVGNIVRVEDHTQTVQHFANQRVDGASTYRYDSLYQLIEANGREAVGANIGPQLPDLNLTPGDTSQLVNYTERYTYDTGGNLTELRHIAQNNNYTRRLQIAEHSNRGLALIDGQPELDFDKGFDANGNLQALQPGQPLRWDSLNQLTSISLLARDNGENDTERYVYDSGGLRVRKVHTTRARSVIHSAEVRYLPGVEIRTKNAERLEVVILQAGRCNLRYMHWAEGAPQGVLNNSMRYSVDDHLGSSTLELDDEANVISHEGYYPYGGTAWWAARSALEAKYKVVRYSGKERDASGLYYYGFRYYAPWLQRWINPDPAGDIDGLNRYQMVGNNPVTLIDANGLVGEEADTNPLRMALGLPRNRASIRLINHAREKAQRQEDVSKLQDAIAIHLQVLKISALRGLVAEQQIRNHNSNSDMALAITRRLSSLAGTTALSGAAGFGGGLLGSLLGTAIAPGPVTIVGGVVGGLVVGKSVGFLVDYIAERAQLSSSVKLKSGALSAEKIFEKAEYKAINLPGYVANKIVKMNPTTPKGALKAGKEITKFGLGKIPYVGPVAKALPDVVEITHEAIGAAGGLSQAKADKLEANISGLIQRIDDSMAKIAALFIKNKKDSISDPELGDVMHRATPASLSELSKEVTDILNQTRMTLNHAKKHP